MRYAIIYAKNEHRNYQMSLNEIDCETDCLKGNKHSAFWENYFVFLNLATALCFSSKLKVM